MRHSLFVFAFVVLVAPLARAQGNYKSAALGGRSALMGDTGVALGNDGAAAFLNPANITRVQSSLALSVNFVSLDFVHASNWYAPGPIDQGLFGNVPTTGADITRLSGNAIPSTFCIFQHLPRINNHTEGKQGIQKLGHCFGTTELSQFDWSGKGYQGTSNDRSVTQASSVRHAWQRFVLAPTYAVNLTENFSIGGAAQLAIDNFSFLNSVGTTTSGGALPATSAAFQSAAGGSSFELSGIIGATYLYDAWTFGASVQSADLTLAGHGNINSYTQFATTATTSSTYLGEGNFHAREPTKFNAGIGYKFESGTSIELDGSIMLADGDALDLDTQGTMLSNPSGASDGPAAVHLHTRYAPIANVNVGAEIYFNKRFSLLTGIGTDFSAVDHLDASSLATSKVDRVFASLGFGSHAPDGGTLLLGMQGYYGWGTMLSPNAYAATPVLAPTNVETYGVLFVIGGTADVKAIEQAVNAVKKAIDPTSPPIHIPDPKTEPKKKDE